MSDDKCPKCGIEGERVSDRAVYVSRSPGELEPVDVHIIDSPACLRRQLTQANERADEARAGCAAAHVAECPDCNGDGFLGHTPIAGRKVACPTCGGHEDSLGIGYVIAFSEDDNPSPSPSPGQALLDRLGELEAIVAKLPLTADGVPAHKDMRVWAVMPDGSVYDTVLGWYCTCGAAFAHQLVAVSCGYRLPNRSWRDVFVDAQDCYSTRAAADSARQGQEKGTP